MNTELKVGTTYVHKKTGKIYMLIQDHLLCKTNIKHERQVYPDSFDDEFVNTYEWDKKIKDNLVLYKAVDENEDGPYFVRYVDDFLDSFEEYVKPYECKSCTCCENYFHCDFAQKNDDKFDANLCESFYEFDDEWAWTR